MKKKNNGGIILGLLAAIFSLIAILCAIAPGFDELARGTGFIVMFGSKDKATNPVPGLIVAFILQIIATFVCLINAFNKSKTRTLFNFFAIALSVVSAVLLILAPQLFAKANPASAGFTGSTALELGSGFITAIVFDFLSALTALLAIYVARHKEN